MAKKTSGMDPTPEIVQILNSQFRLMVAQSSTARRVMKEDHELYYSDVDGTRTQFTSDQLEQIRERYDIPISTKNSWAIIEQMIAFVTGAKPSPRLLASAAVTKDFTNMYEQAIIASLYESHFNRELTMVVRDTFAGGIGWLYVRPNDFFAETTFGVVGEYKPWAQVFVDPHARKPDFSDAEYMCVVDVLPRGKAERRFDVTIPEDEITNFAPDIMWGVDLNVIPIVAGWPFDTGMTSNKRDRYVWVREFFAKQQVNVYISDTGVISSKKPKPTQMPNPDKQALGEQIMQMQQQMQEAMQAAQAEIEKLTGEKQQLEGQLQSKEMDMQIKAVELGMKERELGLKEAETGHRMQMDATAPDRLAGEVENGSVQAITEAALLLSQATAALVQLAESQARAQAAPRVLQVVGPSGQVYQGQSAPVIE